MLSVALDDWVKNGLTDKLGFVFYASKQYPSSSVFDSIYYPTLYIFFIGEKVKRNQLDNSEFATLQLCSLTSFISCCVSRNHVSYFLLCPNWLANIYQRRNSKDQAYLTSSTLLKKSINIRSAPLRQSSVLILILEKCLLLLLWKRPAGPWACPCSVDELLQPRSCFHPSGSIPLALQGWAASTTRRTWGFTRKITWSAAQNT